MFIAQYNRKVFSYDLLKFWPRFSEAHNKKRQHFVGVFDGIIFKRDYFAAL